MKKSRIILGILISAALLVTSGNAVLAQSSEATPTPEVVAPAEQLYQGITGIVGTESDLAGGTIKIETKSLGEVAVLLNDSTIYKVPGQDEATRNDIEIGSRLAILATVNEDGSYTAVRVMIIPDVATRKHISGIVVSVENKIMTVINAAGETMTVELPEGVKGGTVGEFISTSVRKSPGKETPVASGTQTAAEVQTRLQTHLNTAAGQQAATQAEVQTKEQTMARLGEKLEGLMLRNKDVLEQVMAKAPEAAKASIQAAIGNCEQRMEQARQTIQNAYAAAGMSQNGTQEGSQSGAAGAQGK